MDSDIKAWLHDILNAIVEIESFFNDTPKEFVQYKNDVRIKEQLKEISRSLVKL